MPRLRDSAAFTPTPVPMHSASISICIGKASVSAFIALSPAFTMPAVSGMYDTNRLSTTLYSACTIIDSISGAPRRISRLGTGIVPMRSDFDIFFSFFIISPPAQKKCANTQFAHSKMVVILRFPL